MSYETVHGHLRKGKARFWSIHIEVQLQEREQRMVSGSRKNEAEAESSYGVHVLEHLIVCLWEPVLIESGQCIAEPAVIPDWCQPWL